MLTEAYSEPAMSDRACREQYQRFRNGDFNVGDRHSRGRPTVFEDEHLKHMVVSKSRRVGEVIGSQSETVLKCVKNPVNDRNQGYWVPYVLKPRKV